MKILGIDPGYGILGWSVINSEMKIIGYGTIQTASKQRIDQRLSDIHRGLVHIIKTYGPDFAAIEKLFFSRNTTTALDVAKTVGIVVFALHTAGIDYAEYAPVQVKRAITGYGRASKEQMQKMIMTVFGIKEIPKPDDAADALAIAACHVFNSGKIK